MAANVLQTISMISREAAMVLGNTLDLAKRVNREHDKDLAVKAAQIGETVNVRRPIRPTIRTGNAADIQPIVQTFSPITLQNPSGADFALTSPEITFSIDDYSTTTIEPTMAALGSQVEADGWATIMANTFNFVGVPGTPLTGGPTGNARKTLGLARALLQKNLPPMGADRQSFFMDPDLNALLVDSNASLFNAMPEIAKNYTSGFQGNLFGLLSFMNQLTPSHQYGTYAGTPVMAATVPANGSYPSNGVNSSTISTSGWTSGSLSLKVGDKLTIAGVYMVNAQTKAALNVLQQFVVTAPVTDTSGAAVISVSPAIITTGGFQNVSAAPASGAAITMFAPSGASASNGFVFDKDAFMLVTKALEPFSVGPGKTTVDAQTGIPVRVQQMPDIKGNQEILRYDIVYGWAPLYSQLSVGISN